MKELKLLSTGFLQVLFVAMNTYFISQRFYLGALLAGFAISFIWSWNVKKIALGTMKDRLFYSSGAALGSLIGLLLSTLIVK